MTGIRKRIEVGFGNFKNGGSFPYELAWTLDGVIAQSLTGLPTSNSWLYSVYTGQVCPPRKRPITPLHEIAKRILPVDFSFIHPLKITSTQTKVAVTAGLWNATDQQTFEREVQNRGYTVAKHTQTTFGGTFVQHYELTPPSLVMQPDPVPSMTTNYIPAQLVWILDFVSRPHRWSLVKSTKRYLVVKLTEDYRWTHLYPTTITWRDPTVVTSDTTTAVIAVLTHMASLQHDCEYCKQLVKQIEERIK